MQRLESFFRRSLYSRPVLLQFQRLQSKLVREKFNIRPIKTKEEFQNVVINAMVKEGWRPGLKDAECFLACDPTSGFVGELDGQPIGCVTMTKYGDRFAFGGSYIVNKEHRGKEYSRMLFRAAITSVKPSCSIGLLGLMRLEKMYERSGFRSQFYGARYDFHLPTAMTCFSEISEKTPVEITRIREVDLEALFLYDTTVFGFERHAFLSKWLRVTGSHALVAFNTEGSIVGYTVARPTFVKEDGYKIGPVFADSEAIAEKLLKALFKELLRQDEPPPVVCFDAPTKEAMELGEKLQGKNRGFEFAYMLKGDPPKACFDKWFGITTLELG